MFWSYPRVGRKYDWLVFDRENRWALVGIFVSAGLLLASALLIVAALAPLVR